jgi:hypothetical protein
MPTTPKSFASDAEAVAARFLHTAVLVDDEPFKPEGAAIRARAQVEQQAVAKRPGRRPKPVPGEQAEASLDAGEAPAIPSDHDLDPKAVIDAFAREGLICAVLSPSEHENADETLLPAARRADLLVFDWVLYDDDGTRTKRLIEGVLRSDEEPVRGRLRTIAIYTAEPNLHSVAADLKTLLEKHHIQSELVEHDGGLTLERGPVRMTVLAKEGVLNIDDELKDRLLPIADLPKRMISEFSALSAGLVSGVGLASLSAVRDDAHRLLEALPKSLDASFVGHRSALVSPDDATESLVDLVVSELAAVLHEHDVAAHADAKHIERWLTARLAESPGLGTIIVGDNQKSVTFGDDRLRRVVLHGLGDEDRRKALLENWRGVKDADLKTAQRRATELFAASPEAAAASDALLMERMMIRTRYALPKRRLTLGTLVQDLTTGEYLLCVQPRCDSVRIGSKRPFPFLIGQAPKRGKGPDLVTTHNGRAVRLTVPTDPHGLRLIVCLGKNGVCEATGSDGELTFPTDGGKLIWVADLKEEYAQRFAGQLASNLARVGLDEHEIMRLNRGS